MPKVTFHYDGQVKVVEVEPGKKILTIALEHGIPMEHACGGNGFCTTCCCTVRDGESAVKDGSLSQRSDREIAMGITTPNQRLGCQAKVMGDVEVEVGL